ncbi:hypothetical protein CAEBREN_21946 [Caenorhabditis brenneri]|uniref:C2H2-type domain-containing protein n=1 Tax=Caenorhabditis brenneri TaxID=135651 RepID=G0P1Q0_CAEBE|nr:hypothetical protein CAEBREN_21946 [Caenorhabditis brenneri]
MSQSASIDSDYIIDVEYDSDTIDFDDDEILTYDPLFAVENVTTAERLAKYPEMYNIRPMRPKNKLIGFPEPMDLPISPKNECKEMFGARMGSGTSITPVSCEKCNRCFRSPNVLASHKELHDQGNDDLIKSSWFLCPYPECSTECDRQMTLNEHVRIAHGREDLVYETEQFSSWVEFERWKENLEFETDSRFVCISARGTNYGKTVRYQCFFSRAYHPPPSKTSSGMRVRPSRKLDVACTAYMLAREVYGHVHARVCLTHCGHDQHAHLLPLPNTVKKEIAAALMKGMTEEQILLDFTESYDPNDRRHHIRPYEIRNVFNKLLKSQQIHAEHRIHPEQQKSRKRAKITPEEKVPKVEKEEIV